MVTFTASNGSNNYIGDSENDLVDYRIPGTQPGAYQGIEVDLAAGIGIDPFGFTDTFDSIENIRGTSRDDLISGDGKANDLRGYGGSDLLHGGVIDGVFNQAAFQAFRLYQATLDRAPDVDGLLAWTNGLLNGLSVTQAVSGFVNSAEFQSKYGATSDVQFVTLLYNNVLDREPDAEGLSGWTGGLATGLSREAVVLGFADSQEFVENTVVDFMPYTSDVLAANFSTDVFRLYQATLDRAPDAAGLSGWAGALGNGASKLDIVRGFTTSAEFEAKYGATSDAQFVTLLYDNVLDRAPDAEGFSAWTGGLAAGLSREAVVLGFADSVEFINKTNPDVFNYMRSSAASSLADRLDGGAGDDILVGGLGADTFVFIQGESGSDVVADFEQWDIVRFQGFGYSTAGNVLDNMDAVTSPSSSGVLFEDEGQSIFFVGAALSDFSDDTFQFA
jgi:Ca2+-binding RTX toxin-like protein